MRLLRRMVVAVFVLVVVVAVGAGAVWFAAVRPFGPQTATFVDIAPGTSTAEIARELKQDGVIRSALAFEAVKAWEGRRGKTLKAGEYKFDHPAPLMEVYGRIERGDVYTITVVIPEGFDIFDIAQAVAQAGLDSRADFLRAEMQDTELIRKWSPQAQSLEGFLFPATYKFRRNEPAVEMLGAMVRQFGVMAEKIGLQPADATEGPDTEKKIPLGDGKTNAGVSQAVQTTEQIVTLASLIEREVNVGAERAMVAGVFENRLRQGMPLQTDPSVVYASMLQGTWTGVIHESELHSDSPYNTYTHTGLPPGPICNPGVASIEAAMHPAQTDDLYFVANANGATMFARNLAEQNANVAVYRAAIGEPETPKVKVVPRRRLKRREEERKRHKSRR